MSDEARSMRSQLREVDRLGASKAVILGPDEISRRVAKVKDMTSGDEREVGLDKIVEELT
jgi:histidyl-tRNA synthetase